MKKFEESILIQFYGEGIETGAHSIQISRIVDYINSEKTYMNFQDYYIQISEQEENAEIEDVATNMTQNKEFNTAEEEMEYMLATDPKGVEDCLRKASANQEKESEQLKQRKADELWDIKISSSFSHQLKFLTKFILNQNPYLSKILYDSNDDIDEAKLIKTILEGRI